MSVHFVQQPFSIHWCQYCFQLFLLLNCLVSIFVAIGKTASQVLFCFVFHITNAYLNVNFALGFTFTAFFTSIFFQSQKNPAGTEQLSILIMLIFSPVTYWLSLSYLMCWLLLLFHFWSQYNVTVFLKSISGTNSIFGKV